MKIGGTLWKKIFKTTYLPFEEEKVHQSAKIDSNLKAPVRVLYQIIIIIKSKTLIELGVVWLGSIDSNQFVALFILLFIESAPHSQ